MTSATNISLSLPQGSLSHQYTYLPHTSRPSLQPLSSVSNLHPSVWVSLPSQSRSAPSFFIHVYVPYMALLLALKFLPILCCEFRRESRHSCKKSVVPDDSRKPHQSGLHRLYPWFMKYWMSSMGCVRYCLDIVWQWHTLNNAASRRIRFSHSSRFSPFNREQLVTLHLQPEGEAGEWLGSSNSFSLSSDSAALWVPSLPSLTTTW